MLDIRGFRMMINYGSDKVRFPSPVRVGSRIRAGVELTALEQKAAGYVDTNVALQNPDFAATWQQLHASSVRYAKANWEEYLQFELGNSKAPEAAVRAAANPEGYSEEPFPARAVELLTGTKAFLVEQGSIEEDFELDSWLQRPATGANS